MKKQDEIDFMNRICNDTEKGLKPYPREIAKEMKIPIERAAKILCKYPWDYGVNILAGWIDYPQVENIKLIREQLKK